MTSPPSEDDWTGIGTNICLSGGAEGSDLQWGMIAGNAGHRVFHFIFPGHRSKAPEDELVVLSEEQMRVADPFLAKANRTLGRKWPSTNKWVASLLRRNYYQVCDAEAVYAVATIDKGGLVSGGTSWAVQMFLDRFTGPEKAAYVFDQDCGTWFTWNTGWMAIERPPVPSGVYAAVGSRDLKQAGKNAIRDLFGYASSDHARATSD
jgi:hypothetical protein